MSRGPLSVTVTRKEVFPGGTAGLHGAIEEGARDGLNAIGLGMLSTAKAKIQSGGRSGKVYKKRGRIHQASAPGEPPKTDTGALVSSGAFEMDSEGGAMSAVVGFLKKYAEWLEWGTSKMGERPFLRPTITEWQDRIAGIIASAIKARL